MCMYVRPFLLAVSVVVPLSFHAEADFVRNGVGM